MNAERVELAIVGTGRAALSVLSRLPASALAGTVVIDPSGSWLHSFARTQLRLGATHLRSTATQVPFDASCGLERYVEMTGKKCEIVRAVEGFVGVPSVRVYAEYCAKTIAERFGAVRVERGAVVDVRWCDEDSDEVREALTNNSNGKNSGSDLMRFGAVLLTLDSGKAFLAARCVWTPKFSRPLVPSWVIEARASYARSHTDYDGQNASCGIMSTRDVDVSAEDTVRDKSILIVGGGWTAATLALAAQSKGAKFVTLMSRRKIVVSEFECDVKYFGYKGLREFLAGGDAQSRAKSLESCKTQASMNEHTHRRLREAEAHNAGSQECNLTVFEQKTVTGARWGDEEGKWLVTSKPTDDAKIEFESEQFRAYRDEGIEPSPQALAAFEREETTAYDEIWLACGELVDLASDSVLQTLVETTPVEIAKGFPLLVEEDFEDVHERGLKAAAGGGGGCRWPGTSLYVIGAYASLTMGPCADLPVGHRVAAKQIIDVMKKHQKMVLRGKNPYRCAVDLSKVVRTPERGESFERIKRLPIELSDKGLIDINNMLGGMDMERVELDHYELYEEDMFADVRLKLPEAIDAHDVYVCFENRAVEMWAIGKKRVYRFFIRKLYKEVISDKCSYKVYLNKQRVVIRLHKFSNHYWQYLKG